MSEAVQIKKTLGNCSCGEPVTRIENCPFAVHVDGVRYDYTDRMTLHLNIFRCRNCDGVIYDTWKAEKTANALEIKARTATNLRA